MACKNSGCFAPPFCYLDENYIKINSVPAAPLLGQLSVLDPLPSGLERWPQAKAVPWVGSREPLLSASAGRRESSVLPGRRKKIVKPDAAVLFRHLKSCWRIKEGGKGLLSSCVVLLHQLNVHQVISMLNGNLLAQK